MFVVHYVYFIISSFADGNKMENCHLAEDDYDMVKVSSIVNPQLIYLRLDENSNRLSIDTFYLKKIMKTRNCFKTLNVSLI